jgi:hypothetical protein
MVIKGMLACNPVKVVYDEYYTRARAWEDIAHYIPRDKILLESFMLNSVSSSPLYLQELGFQVEWDTSSDFFQQEKRENAVCVSNCPFSLKKEVLQHLKQIDQPFILIISSTVLNTKYFLETFSTDKRIQLIIKSSKIHFDKYVDGKKVEMKDNTSFYSLYLCWQIGLEFDINFIK